MSVMKSIGNPTAPYFVISCLIRRLLSFAVNGKLKPDLFHGLAHERGEIGRLPGRDQIGVNNHLPVLIERAGLFQFISHRLVTGGASPLQKTGADQDLWPMTDGGNRIAAGTKAPG